MNISMEQIVALLEAGQYEQARGALIALAVEEPDNKGIWMTLAGLAIRTDDDLLGMEAFGEWVRLEPDSAVASSGLVDCLENLGEHETARLEQTRFSSYQ